MTALCSGAGPSQIRPGFGNTIQITGAGLAGMLNNVPTPYAVAFAAGLEAIVLDLTSMCVTDPPAQPVMGPTDWAALVLPAWTPQNQAAVKKFGDWITYFLWFQLCQCVTGAQPTPTIPTPPASVPQVNPPVSNGPAAPCWHGVLSKSNYGGGTFNIGGGPLIGGLQPTFIRWTATNTIHSGAGTNITLVIQQDHTSGGTVTDRTDNLVVPIGTTVVLTVPFNPALSTFNQVSLTGPGPNFDGSDLLVVEEWFCGTSPTLGSSPCCPPDPALAGLLGQILDYVKVIQRQIVPFAYNLGAAHAALTGAGSLTVFGLVGMKVEPTLIPGNLGHLGTSPEEFFDMGFVTWGTADGDQQSERVTHSPYLTVPPRCSAFTAFKYDLPPGVQITATELIREP